MYIESVIEHGSRAPVGTLYFGILNTSFANGASFTKSSGSSLTVTPTLGNPLEYDLPVTVTISGGHSQYENFGTGKHYTVSCSGATIVNDAPNETTITKIIPAGDTSINITLQIYNNPVWELDRKITVTALGFGSKYFTITDDHAGNLVLNAVTDYAVWGGSYGLTEGSESAANDNKSVIEAIVSYVRNIPGWDATVNNCIIYVPEGEYYFEHGIYLWPGFSIVGAGVGNTTLRRPSKSWYIANGYPVADGGYYYYKMFTYRTTGDYWNAADDSTASGLRDLSYNGNFDTFWPFSPYTLFEQSTTYAPLIRNHASLFGRMLVVVENVHFDNEITTYVSCVDNVDCRYCNVTCTNSVEKKGQITNVGGNYSVNAKWISTDANQWDIEVNSATSGHFEDGRCDVSIYDSDIWKVEFGGPLATGTQTVYFEDCTVNMFSLNWGSADVHFKNCTTTCQDLEAYGNLDWHFLRNAKSFLYEGGSITINPPVSGNAGNAIYCDLNRTSEIWEFRDCEIIKGSGTFPSGCYAFYEENVRTPGTTIKLSNVIVTGSFNAVLKNNVGGRYIVENGLTVNGAASVFHLMGYDINSYNLDLSVSGTIDSNAPIWLETPCDSAGTGNTVYHNVTGLTKSNNKIYVTTASGTPHITGWSFTGSREVTGTGVYTISGLPGDVYTATDVSYTYDCTAIGYERANPVLNVQATYVRRPVTGWNYLVTPIDITSLMTADSTWRTTATITDLPSNAQSILLICSQSDTTSRTVGFRRPGVTTDTKFGGTYSYKPFFAVVGLSSRTLGYYASSLTNTSVKILAYSTESSCIESGTLPNYTPAGTGTYYDKTFSEMSSTAVWAVCQLQKTTSVYRAAARDDGESYDYYSYRCTNANEMVLIPTTNKVGEIKIEHTALVHLLTAWLPGGKITPVSYDITGLTVNTWTTLDWSSIIPAGAEMAVVEVINTSTSSNYVVGFRLVGSTVTDRPGITYHSSTPFSQFRLVPLDIARQTQINVSNKDYVAIRIWGYVTNT